MVHLFHAWGKWSDIYIANVQRLINGVIFAENPTEVQDRTCEKCGKYQWRKV